MSNTVVSKTRSWRTVDIVVAAVFGVAFGVVFWAWNLLGTVVGPALAFFAPVAAILNGVFLMPGVIAGLVIRKPGAAIVASTLAATVSILLGSPYGGIIIVYGLVQGIGAEVGFALLRYRRFGLAAALLAAVTAGVSTAVLDLTYYYSTWPLHWMGSYLGLTVLSSMLLAGLGGWFLVRALAASGALSSFPV
ncbi:MAG: ECF transporter S component, partial [Geodermatophilaceae bacterium]|nr:ECF transporter S component [Geodermatophilaceae bacterium]